MLGCRKPDRGRPDIAIEHHIAPSPPHVGPVSVTLQLSGPGGKAIGGAHIGLEAEMSHPGMAPQFADAHEVAAGQYEGRLNLTMAGDWVILIHGHLAGGGKLERQFEVKGVTAD